MGLPARPTNTPGGDRGALCGLSVGATIRFRPPRALAGGLGVWPKEDGTPTPAYRMMDLYFADYAAASAAAAEAGPLVGATLKHATGGVVIAFAEVIEDA
jgi:hypothetical protein